MLEMRIALEELVLVVGIVGRLQRALDTQPEQLPADRKLLIAV